MAINAILQAQLDEDERRDRTEFLKEDMKPSDWLRYQSKQLFFAMLRWGGNWRKE